MKQHNFEAVIVVKTNKLQTYSPSDEDNLVRSNTLDEQFIYACNQDLSPVEPRKQSENIEYLNELLLEPCTKESDKD